MRQSGLFGKKYVKSNKRKAETKVLAKPPTKKQDTLGFAKPKAVVVEEEASTSFGKYAKQSEKQKQKDYRKKLEAAVRDLPCLCKCAKCRGRMKLVMGAVDAYIDDCEECFGRTKFGKETTFSDKDDRVICKILNEHGPPWRRTAGDKWPNLSLVLLHKKMPSKSEAAIVEHVNTNFTTTHSSAAVHLPHGYRGWYRKQYQTSI